MNEIIAIVQEKENQELITKEKTIEYAKTFLTNQLNDNEIMQFSEVAAAFNLNPYKREIYCVPYTDKRGKRNLSIITGYEVYLKRAEKLNLMSGWNATTEGSLSNSSLKAVITIHRKDWKHPFIHEVYFKEYFQASKPLWNSKPVTMIKKVGIAQAFRLCFPEGMGGMPYTSDELPDEMTHYKDVTQSQEAFNNAKKAIENNAPKEIVVESKIQKEAGKMIDDLEKAKKTLLKQAKNDKKSEQNDQKETKSEQKDIENDKKGSEIDPKKQETLFEVDEKEFKPEKDLMELLARAKMVKSIMVEKDIKYFTTIRNAIVNGTYDFYTYSRKKYIEDLEWICHYEKELKFKNK